MAEEDCGTERRRKDIVKGGVGFYKKFQEKEEEVIEPSSFFYISSFFLDNVALL